MPTPAGRSQPSKDRAAAAEAARLQAQADRFWRQQTRSRWVHDEQLDDLGLPALRAEAELRRVPVPAKGGKPALLAALRAATAAL